ncbi:signal peptidase I [Microbacterium sp.]|uniref:signal peptidase I n=1 Tax=Microbacterium sp. TaxID=51671 RepID=UPI0027352C5D|nr:signal peptidase I [Microbacterium sp.]MDP3950402.1 signal peptidase I [Microbacterium sp.]
MLRAEQAEDGGAPTRHRMPSPGVVIGEVLLWFAAVLGVICIVLIILAYSANITLIMFRTGSMAPTIPAGSVALVQDVPASEIAVGDVVTVERPDELPVTHRVTSIEVGPAAAERIITLRGDANADEDPFPYTVEAVRIVRFAVPGLAPVIVALSNPFVLGAITIAAAALVGWAFWPHAPRRIRQERATPVPTDVADEAVGGR